MPKSSRSSSSSRHRSSSSRHRSSSSRHRSSSGRHRSSSSGRHRSSSSRHRSSSGRSSRGHRKRSRRSGSSSASGADSKRRHLLTDGNKTDSEHSQDGSQDGKADAGPGLDSIAGYTNEDNPFGDPNLTQKFVWGKKAEAQGAHAPKPGEIVAEAAVTDAEREAQVLAEIEKVKKRRADREAETAMMEAMKLQQMREREAENFSLYQAKEETFYKETALQRSTIRIREGRARPIDIFALLLDLHSADKLGVRASTLEANAAKQAKLAAELASGHASAAPSDPEAASQVAKDAFSAKLATLPICVYELVNPVVYLNSLSLEKLELLATDARANRDADPQENLWHLLIALATHFVSVLESAIFAQLADSNAAAAHDTLAKSLSSSAAVHASVSGDVSALLSGKSLPELVELEATLKSQLADPALAGAIDSEFFSTVLDNLAMYKMQAELSDMYTAALARQVVQLSELTGAAAPAHPGAVSVQDRRKLRLAAFVSHVGVESVGPHTVSLDLIKHSDHVLNPMSTHPLSLSQAASELRNGGLGAEGESVDPAFEDELEELRDEMVQEAAAALGPERYALWDDKYRPRKPIYFARVVTGYVWHKYNRAHYSKEAPPPRQVQGFKLSVLLPDLVDPTKTPSMDIIPNGDETATLIISPGPPYQDLAFTIIDKPIDKRSWRGYRCVFDRNVLRISFRYKHNSYRR